MLNYIENSEIYEDLQAQFNQNFFETNKQVIEKQKELLKLEKDTDYSEQEYEMLLRRHFDTTDSKAGGSSEENDAQELLSEGDEDNDGFDEDNSELLREVHAV